VKHHLRLMATLGMCLAAYGLLLEAFHLLNQSRDSSVLGGIAMIFALLVFVPPVVRTIWRRL